MSADAVALERIVRKLEELRMQALRIGGIAGANVACLLDRADECREEIKEHTQ